MSNAARPSKADRQSAAREKARIMREAEQKKRRRNRFIVQGSVGLAILIVAAIVVVIVVQVTKPVPPANTAGPANMISDGIVLTGTTKNVTTGAIANGGVDTPTDQATLKAKVHITIYEDLQCPICNDFESGGDPASGQIDTGNDTQLAAWLDAGLVDVEIHPISFLDSSSNGNKYSTRAANAMACVANYAPADFFAVNKALYQNQPAENGSGKTDDQIISVVQGVGATDTTIADCIRNQTYVGWVSAATARVMGPDANTNPASPLPNTTPSIAKITGTPTVIVNGKQYAPASSVTTGWANAAAFKSFVESTAGVTLP